VIADLRAEERLGDDLERQAHHVLVDVARLAVAPISVSEVFAGKLMARVIIGVAQLLVLLLFAHFVFGLKLGHSPAALMVRS